MKGLELGMILIAKQLNGNFWVDFQVRFQA